MPFLCTGFACDLFASQPDLWHGGHGVGLQVTRHEQAELAAQAYQQEITSLKEQLQTKTQEARELSHMLRAWEAMRAGKDQQIAQVCMQGSNIAA